MYGAADEIVPLLVKGDLDAAAVPANLAATLYQRTEGQVEVACINTLGVLYILEQGDTVQSVADLKGPDHPDHRQGHHPRVCVALCPDPERSGPGHRCDH